MRFDVKVKGVTVVLLLMLLQPLALRAQNDQLRFQLGVKGGLQLTEMTFSGDALKSSNRVGYSIGPVLKFKTPIVGFGIDAAVLYDQRDLTVDGQVLKQKSLLIPAHARLGADVFSLLGIFLCAGPQFSFNVGDDMLHWQDASGRSKQFALQNTTLSLNIGAGVTLGRHLEGAVYYNIPVGKTADFTESSLSASLQGESWSHAKSTVDAWRLCVSYFF